MNDTTLPRELHLCDFDGTQTRGDTLLQFLFFAVPAPSLLLGGFILIFRFLGLIFSGNWSNAAGKAAVLAAYFKGESIESLFALGQEFNRQKLPGLIRPDLLQKLRDHHQAGHEVVIVSASLNIWLGPFCTAENFGLLCTELAFDSGKFKGKFATPNCNGAEKARRIQAAYALEDYDRIFAYGNSGGDAAMFLLADEVFRF